MRLFKLIPTAFIILLMTHFCLAQPSDKSNSALINRICGEIKYELPNSDYVAILYNGNMMMIENSLDPLMFNPQMDGKVTISAIDRKINKIMPDTSIGFKVAIKDNRTNTVWMYSDETYYELDLKQVLKKCVLGDKIMFMTVDRKYQLPRHEVVVMAGC